MTKIFTTLFLTLLAIVNLVAPITVNAQYAVAQPPTRQFLIDKLVLNPASGEFVDNLNINQFKFLPNQEVTFRINLKNTGGADWNNVSLKDKLPNELMYVSSAGNYDKNSHTVTFSLSNLRVNETKSFDVKLKVKSDAELPMNVTCVSNLAEANFDNNVAQDTAGICIQKKVLGTVVELPKTGPADVALQIGALVMLLSVSGYSFVKARGVK